MGDRIDDTGDTPRSPSLAEVRRRLRTMGTDPGDISDLATAAIDLGALNRPGLRIDAYYRHLDTLVADVRAYAGDPREADVAGALDALVQVIARRYGYGGGEDVFEDIDAANLTRVIDNRDGLPVAVGILYIHVARAVGWHAAGVDFPGRFLVRLEVEGERRLFDPYDDGRSLEPHDLRELLKSGAGLDAELEPHHYREASNRQVLVRLQNNIKVRLLKRDAFDDALQTIKDTLLIAPENASLWREAGMIHNRLDQVKDAIMALEEFIRLDTGSESRYSTSVLLQQLRAKLN
ncbi:MAG: transglutaminase-like domain-containing protein [Rhodospirillales bacterium]